MGSIGLDELNVALCAAFGVDPRKNQGFQLTVRGGEAPALEVFVLPPVDEQGAFSDEWVEALEPVRELFELRPVRHAGADRHEDRPAQASGPPPAERAAAVTP